MLPCQQWPLSFYQQLCTRHSFQDVFYASFLETLLLPLTMLLSDQQLFSLVFQHHARRSSFLSLLKVYAVELFKLDKFFLQVSGIFGNQLNILNVNVFDCGPGLFAKRALVSVLPCDESRFGVRLPLWTPPSSLALTRVSKHYLISNANCLRSSMSVTWLRSLQARLS